MFYWYFSDGYVFFLNGYKINGDKVVYLLVFWVLVVVLIIFIFLLFERLIWLVVIIVLFFCKLFRMRIILLFFLFICMVCKFIVLFCFSMYILGFFIEFIIVLCGMKSVSLVVVCGFRIILLYMFVLRGYLLLLGSLIFILYLCLVLVCIVIRFIWLVKVFCG